MNIENCIFLLGAGASRPAGVPTACEMTTRMLAMFRENSIQRHYLRATRAIIGALQMAAGIEEGKSSSAIDIEQVLSAAKLLSTRFATELFPFVGAWHPLLEELERQYVLVHLDHAAPFDSAHLAKLLAKILGELPNGQFFQRLVSVLTAKLIELTWITDRSGSSYLQPLIDNARNHRLVIATLNYDNTIENAAALSNVCCHTLGEWQTTSALPQPSTGVDLLKLHGSINWKWSDRPGASAGITFPRTIREVAHDDMPNQRRRARIYNDSPHAGDAFGLIFGGGNKLTAEGPFMDLLYKFKSLLWNREHLFVIGYSFRDNHINYLIEHWFTPLSP